MSFHEFRRSALSGGRSVDVGAGSFDMTGVVMEACPAPRQLSRWADRDQPHCTAKRGFSSLTHFTP